MRSRLAYISSELPACVKGRWPSKITDKTDITKYTNNIYKSYKYMQIAFATSIGACLYQSFAQEAEIITDTGSNNSTAN